MRPRPANTRRPPGAGLMLGRHRPNIRPGLGERLVFARGMVVMVGLHGQVITPSPHEGRRFTVTGVNSTPTSQDHYTLRRNNRYFALQGSGSTI